MKSANAKLLRFARRIRDVKRLLIRETKVHDGARLLLRNKGKRQVEAHGVYGWHSLGTSGSIFQGVELRHHPYYFGSIERPKREFRGESRKGNVSYAHVPADLDVAGAHFPFGPLRASSKSLHQNSKLVDRHRVNSLVDDAIRLSASRGMRREMEREGLWSGTTFKLKLLSSLLSKLRLKCAFQCLAGEIARRSIKSRLLRQRVAYMRMLRMRSGGSSGVLPLSTL